MSGVTDALGQGGMDVKDNLGKSHVVPPMTFGDARDLERALGKPFGDVGDALASFDGQIKILWVVLRREGLTRQQIREYRASGKWPLSEEDVADMFDLNQAVKVFGALTRSLAQGGMEAAQDPTAPVAPDAVTQGEAAKTTPG